MFDVLSMNGEVLVNKPLLERKAVLTNSFPTSPSHGFLFVPWSEQTTDLQINMKQSLEMGCEGLVLKRKESVYSPGGRSSTF